MNRKELMKQMLDQRRKITMDYHKWLSTPREYFPGDALYMREVHILMEIGLNGIDNVSRLGEKLEITQGAVSQQLKKLEKKGYLIRIQDAGDKRQYSVQLTEKGRRLYERHRQYDNQGYNEIYQLFNDFSDEELETVHRFDSRFAQVVAMMKHGVMKPGDDWSNDTKSIRKIK